MFCCCLFHNLLSNSYWFGRCKNTNSVFSHAQIKFIVHFSHTFSIVPTMVLLLLQWHSTHMQIYVCNTLFIMHELVISFSNAFFSLHRHYFGMDYFHTYIPHTNTSTRSFEIFGAFSCISWTKRWSAPKQFNAVALMSVFTCSIAVVFAMHRIDGSN